MHQELPELVLEMAVLAVQHCSAQDRPDGLKLAVAEAEQVRPLVRPALDLRLAERAGQAELAARIMVRLPRLLRSEQQRAAAAVAESQALAMVMVQPARLLAVTHMAAR